MSSSSPAPPRPPSSVLRALGHEPLGILSVSQLASHSDDLVLEVALLRFVLWATGNVFAVGPIFIAVGAGDLGSFNVRVAGPERALSMSASKGRRIAILLVENQMPVAGA